MSPPSVSRGRERPVAPKLPAMPDVPRIDIGPLDEGAAGARRGGRRKR
jgi:hypothetical protein